MHRTGRHDLDGHGQLSLIKGRKGAVKPAFEIPFFVPFLGAAICALLILYVDPRAFLNLTVLILLGLASYFFSPARKQG